MRFLSSLEGKPHKHSRLILRSYLPRQAVSDSLTGEQCAHLIALHQWQRGV